jgi:methyltransferase
MVSQSLFTIFVLAIACQRVQEYFVSERHRRWLLQQGGREHGSKHFPFMVALHVFWLLAMLMEVWIYKCSYHFVLVISAGVIFSFGQCLRLLAMYELRERWTARIITIPGLSPVTSGVFRYIRHPNYLGVVLEIATVPLFHSAMITSIIFSLLNLMMLKIRIAEEEKALNQDNQYDAVFMESR